MLWNKLCDEDADSVNIVNQLSKNNAEIVLSTQIIYEMAKTFVSQKSAARERAIRLFSFFAPFTRLHTRCMNMNPSILAEEAHFAAGGQESINIFLGDNDYRSMVEEVEKLSKGIFESRVQVFIASRERQASDLRVGTLNHIASLGRNQLALLKSAHDPESWLIEAKKIFGRQLIREHLVLRFPDEPVKRMTYVAKQIISSRACRLSHAVVAADLYVHFRAARNDAIPRDLLPDLDHMVNASHCDLYLTAEAGQGKYAHFVLRNTIVAVYDGSSRVIDWLFSVISKMKP